MNLMVSLFGNGTCGVPRQPMVTLVPRAADHGGESWENCPVKQWLILVADKRGFM